MSTPEGEGHQPHPPTHSRGSEYNAKRPRLDAPAHVEDEDDVGEAAPARLLPDDDDNDNDDS